MECGYDKVKTPGFKAYVPKLILPGRVRHSRKAFKTASEAKNYAIRWMKRINA